MNDEHNGADALNLTETQHGRREFLFAALAAGAAGSVLAPAGSSYAASSSSTCTGDNAPLREVNGKVAFITGGSRGIGLAIAQACLNAGMKTVITWRTREHLDDAMKSLSAFGDRVYPLRLDVTDAAAVDAAADDAMRHFGKLHLLVANAGAGVGVPSFLAPNTREMMQKAWDLHVNGTLYCVQSIVPKIRAHGEGGHVVATSSVEGLFAGAPVPVYGLSKAALIYMMEALRAELKQSNIGVSAFCPGAVNTQAGNLDGGNAPAFPDVMAPSEAARIALEGIRANRMFILSHPEYRGIKDRCDVLVASNPNTPVPAARVRLTAPMLSSDIYPEELARLRCARRART
jgi:NAD(P)-dependent dehydrogenase (short-subunit alcohol dehydrogenase family)